MTFLINLRFAEIFCSLRLVLEWKADNQKPEKSVLEFLEKLSANSFVLLDPQDNVSGSLNRGGTADFPLLNTKVAIHHKPREPNFREVIDSLILLINFINRFY